MKMITLFLCMVVFWQQTFAATIGSDSAVTRFNTQQTLNNGDVVAAFAALQGGFVFLSSSVQALVRTIFPVSGDIELNGGTLVLGRDLVLSEVADFKSLGTIFGNGYSLDLAATTSCIPSENPINCSIRFLTSSAQVDEVLSVDWSFDDKIIAIGLDASGAVHDNLFIYLFDGTTLTFAYSTIVSSFSDIRVVRWHPTKLILAVGKQNTFAADLFTVVFDSMGMPTGGGSGDNVGTINAVAWHPTGDYLASGGTSSTAEIRLYPVSAVGVLDTVGRLDVNVMPNINVQKEALDWDITGSYLAVGFNNSAGAENFRIYEFNDQPSLSLVQNAGDEIVGNDTECVSWHPTCSSIIAMCTDATTDNVRIYNHDGALGTVIELTTLSLPEPVRCIHWSPDGNCLAIGTDVGTGDELSTYLFNKNTFALTQVVGFDFSDDVQSVRWDHAGDNLAVGNDDDSLYVYESISLDNCVTFSDINLALKCNVEFKNCCIIFSGNNTIRGCGKNLTLQSTCTFVVDSDSTLLLKDITVKEVQDTNIQFMDNSSTLSLQDVTWVLDDDFTFTNGHFDVLKDFHVIGSGKKVIYQSEVQSTIQECGKLILDDGVTFSYDPVTDARSLLLLVADTSELVLNGATLHSTSTGLRLTTGVLTVDQDSFISSEGSIDSESISFGDGTNVNKNLCLNVLPAAHLELLQGCLAYNDV